MKEELILFHSFICWKSNLYLIRKTMKKRLKHHTDWTIKNN